MIHLSWGVAPAFSFRAFGAQLCATLRLFTISPVNLFLNRINYQLGLLELNHVTAFFRQHKFGLRHFFRPLFMLRQPDTGYCRIYT